jgi:hypothetical protein
MQPGSESAPPKNVGRVQANHINYRRNRVLKGPRVLQMFDDEQCPVSFSHPQLKPSQNMAEAALLRQIKPTTTLRQEA